MKISACAREEKTNVSRMVLFDKDDGPAPLLQKFEAREKVARKSPFDRNVKKVLGFLGIRKSARDEILTFFLKTIGFLMFLCLNRYEN